jgi:hypothetical protein
VYTGLLLHITWHRPAGLGNRQLLFIQASRTTVGSLDSGFIGPSLKPLPTVIVSSEMAHQPATPPTNSNRACHDYNRLIILLVLADYHTLANLHHPRWDLNTSQGPNSKPDDREEDQE